MIPFLLGGTGLAVLHALLPNHWLPIVAVGAREGWGRAALARAAALIALAHVASSVAVGVLVGAFGVRLGNISEPLLRGLSGGVLVLFGLWVWWTEGNCEGRGCGHADGADAVDPSAKMVGTLALSMFLSPCLELDAYYLQAARWGWEGIAALSLIYIFVTVPLISALVLAGERMRARLGDRLHGLEHAWGKVAGGLLVAMGIASFFLEV